MTWSLPDTYHSAGHGRGTATLKFYEGRDILYSAQRPASDRSCLHTAAYRLAGKITKGYTFPQATRLEAAISEDGAAGTRTLTRTVAGRYVMPLRVPPPGVGAEKGPGRNRLIGDLPNNYLTVSVRFRRPITRGVTRAFC
jgi:hypothetical protein